MALWDGFIRATKAFPDRPALECAGHTLTYAGLRDRACAIAAALPPRTGASPSLTGIYARRSTAAFEGVLGALLAGDGYVPLGPAFPPARSRLMLDRAECQAIVIDRTSEPALAEVIEGISRPLTLIFPEHASKDELSDTYEGHQSVCADALPAPDDWTAPETSPDDVAYVLFTSGSTGKPKGVMVAHRNVEAFLDHVIERYGFNEDDRFSQTFSLTFDLSVFDLFCAWSTGGCLCCPSAKALFKPGKYIRESTLTVWFSVPTTAAIMQRLGELKPDAYPGLRWSLFCGEALPAELAQQWAAAAPKTIVENLYGPTELTIACAGYRWSGDASIAESENSVAPIGLAFPHMSALVVDEDLREVPEGAEGELIMTGPQVALGYLNDDKRTREAFVTPLGNSERHYRTGDRVRRPKGDKPLRYLGRIDHQIKIRGYRVELSEIEAALRDAAKVGTAVAIGWPMTARGAEGVIAFIDASDVDATEIRGTLRRQLPDYMVPREIRQVESFPRGGSGKIDRNALTRMLEESK